MSKEMTPKEALQMIQDNLTPRVLGIFPVEFHIVKEALDRLELLEKENQELKEDLRLTTIERNVCENIYEALEEKYFKLKKVIEILKGFDFDIYSGNGLGFIQPSIDEPLTLTQQEYDLLKEVLESV